MLFVATQLSLVMVAHSFITAGRLQTVASYSSTTSSAANMHINSSGLIVRSTSSARFKTNVETMEDSYADAIPVRPVWYNSIASDDTVYPEVTGVSLLKSSLRLTHAWFTTARHKETLIADGIQYERFVPHLVNVVKRQKVAGREELEAKVGTQHNRSEAENAELKAKVALPKRRCRKSTTDQEINKDLENTLRGLLLNR